MPRKEAPINQLESYLPPNTYNAVLQYLHQYRVHLTVARERKSILGDYRHRTHGKTHRISVNGNWIFFFGKHILDFGVTN